MSLPCQAGDIIVPNNMDNKFIGVTVVYRHYVVLNIENVIPHYEYFPLLQINTICAETGEERLFKVAERDFDFHFRKVDQDAKV